MRSLSNPQVDELDILRGVETVITTIKAERDTEKLLSEICGKVLEIFGCNRSWLLFPRDPAEPGDPTCFHVRFRLDRRGDTA